MEPRDRFLFKQISGELIESVLLFSAYDFSMQVSLLQTLPRWVHAKQVSGCAILFRLCKNLACPNVAAVLIMMHHFIADVIYYY